MIYKGVEYDLMELAKDRWAWIFFPTIKNELPNGGEVAGTRERAEIACMTAINRWLAVSIEVPPAPRLVTRRNVSPID
jgi:hypothetical protein